MKRRPPGRAGGNRAKQAVRIAEKEAYGGCKFKGS